MSMPRSQGVLQVNPELGAMQRLEWDEKTETYKAVPTTLAKLLKIILPIIVLILAGLLVLNIFFMWTVGYSQTWGGEEEIDGNRAYNTGSPKYGHFDANGMWVEGTKGGFYTS